MPFVVYFGAGIKSRITNAEVTAAEKLSIAAWQEQLYLFLP